MRRSLPAVLLVALLSPAVANATTVEFLGLDALIEQASTIVRGLVVDRSSRWEGQLLLTDISLDVTECIAGDCDPEHVVITVMGGEAAGLTMVVEGAAQFEAGEAVVLFLAPSAQGLHRTVGMAQGKFRVTETGEPMLRSLQGLALQQGSVTAQHFVDPLAGVRLEDVRSRVAHLSQTVAASRRSASER